VPEDYEKLFWHTPLSVILLLQ